MDEINVLDHGYLRFVEAWGHGDASPAHMGDQCDFECGIIEAARQSTQGSFRGWDDTVCIRCEGTGEAYGADRPFEGTPDNPYPGRCPVCDGSGYIPGDRRLLAYLDSHRHTTPFEFSGMVIEVKAPIAVFREWHRHRTQSYNEMSARYAPLPNENYVPTVERCMVAAGKNKQAAGVRGADELTTEFAIAWLAKLAAHYDTDEALYQEGLNGGIPKELARMCLPVGRYSQMRACCNLLNWLRFLLLRMAPDAQYEIRMYANTVGDLVALHFPRTWQLFKAGKEFTK